jgi:hypothetical protein
VVEHVAAGEEQYSDQTECSPEVAVLQDRCDVRPGNGKKGDGTEAEDGDRADLGPVNGTGNGWFGRVGGDLARDPSVDLFGGLGTVGEVEANGLGVDFGVGANRGVEVEEDGRGLEHHLCDVSVSVIIIDTRRALPTGKCSFRQQSPVCRTEAFPRLSCRLWSNSCLGCPTQAGSSCIARIRISAPMQSRVRPLRSLSAPWSIAHSLHRRASMGRRWTATSRGSP